ncbi:MAG: radical SAM protein [Pseudomonadales bacterium]
MSDQPLISREFPARFSDPERTLDGSRRARVSLSRLETLWINTGTLCNLTCENCYIESSPRNDRLSYISRAEVAGYLAELETLGHDTRTIGFTGGEPFMNPEFIGMLEDSLEAGYEVLILSNAMKPMTKCREPLLALQRRHPRAMQIRVSMDHFRRELHEQERGPRSWQPMLDGVRWLSDRGFRLSVAGRTRWGEQEPALRQGYAALFAAEGIAVDADDPQTLVLFPEMDASAEVPEITEACWDILGVEPVQMMCAGSRMVVKRRGAAAPAVVACTLLPYDGRFELGRRLSDSFDPVPLNHPHCARFCVLGGGSCSTG